jgi:hypothetical protein
MGIMKTSVSPCAIFGMALSTLLSSLPAMGQQGRGPRAEQAPIPPSQGDAAPADSLRAASTDVEKAMLDATAEANNSVVRAEREKAEKAEKALDEVKKKAETDKAHAEDAKAQLRNGTLMTSGFTGGIALAIQTTGPSRDNAKQEGTKATTMPYILMLPVYWATPQATREACASSWGGGGDADALAAARAVASRQASTLFDAVVDGFAARGVGEGSRPDPEYSGQVATALGLDSIYGDGVGTQVANMIAGYYAAPGDAKTSRKQAIIKHMTDLVWKPALTANCWSKRFGVWLGYPLSYETTTKVPDDGEGIKAKRKITPLLAFGVGFSPNKYFTLMYGFTVGQVSGAATDTAPAVDDETVWVQTIAFGGNLDIIAALAK